MVVGRIRGAVDLAVGGHGDGAGDDLRRGGTGQGKGDEDGVHVEIKTADSRDGVRSDTLVAKEW